MNYPSFGDDIARMNSTYELPAVETFDEMSERIGNFEKILKEECEEIKDIKDSLNAAGLTAAKMLRARVMLADLLGDIIVYCASEAQRWNIPVEEVLAIIMASNFSKLDAEGKPIKDERGKFLKGPNYWKPEPYIQALLEGYDVYVDAAGNIRVHDPVNSLQVKVDMDAVVAAATQRRNQPEEKK